MDTTKEETHRERIIRYLADQRRKEPPSYLGPLGYDEHPQLFPLPSAVDPFFSAGFGRV